MSEIGGRYYDEPRASKNLETRDVEPLTTQGRRLLGRAKEVADMANRIEQRLWPAPVVNSAEKIREAEPTLPVCVEHSVDALAAALAVLERIESRL